MFIYITRVNMVSQAAQSKQIRKMCNAFHNVLGNDFKLVCGGEAFESDFNAKSIGIHKNKLLTYLKFAMICFFWGFKSLFSRRKNVYFTRDIVLALILSAFGMTCVYEAHKEPVSSITSKVFTLCTFFNSFKVLSISKALNDWYVKHFDLSEGAAFFFHDAVDPYQKETKLEPSIFDFEASNQKVIAHTGNPTRGGLDFIGHILAEIPEVFFLHVGGSEEEIKSLRHSLIHKGTENFLLLPSTSQEVCAYIQRKADYLFYVLPESWPTCWCASPLKVFEYMNSGTPIYSSNKGSVTEVLNEENCFFYELDDVKQSITIFKNMLDEPELAQKIAAKARLDVRKYTWEARVEHILQAVDYEN